jgi:hypothetical protein
MPNPRRKGKDEFWVGVIVAGVIVYSLLASWWKEHVILGSIILSVLLVVAGYVLYKYASLRGWLGHQVKDTIQKTVFENVASEREPLSPYERDEVKTPEGFKKGEAFQDYIRKHLFTKDKFDMLHKTHSYATNKNDYIIEDSEEPDFKFRVIRTGKAFWVEAKYRSRYYEDKVDCYKPLQLKRYKEIDKKFPVYITLGLGGEPDSPDQVFLIPIRDIEYSYSKLFLSFLKNYKVPNDKPIDYKRLQ